MIIEVGKELTEEQFNLLFHFNDYLVRGGRTSNLEITETTITLPCGWKLMDFVRWLVNSSCQQGRKTMEHKK